MQSGVTRHLAKISKLPIFHFFLYKMVKMASNDVKWSKMLIFLTISNDNCPFKKTGGRVTSKVPGSNCVGPLQLFQQALNYNAAEYLRCTLAAAQTRSTHSSIVLCKTCT